jgi:phosphoketolase
MGRTHFSELGYALSVSFGAVMDNPDLVVTCVIGGWHATVKIVLCSFVGS